MENESDAIAIEANSSRQIKKGVVIGYLSIAFNVISGLIYTPWMVRQIGQADYGLFALAVSFISFLALDFGLGSAVTRFLCQYKARGDKEGAKRLLGLIFKLFLGISTLIFVVLVVAFFFIENIYVKLTPEEIARFRVVFAVSGLFTVVSFGFKPLDGIIGANERFIFSKLAALFHKVGVVVLMVAALLLGYGLYALVIVNAFVGLVVIAMKLFYVRKTTDDEIDFSGGDKALVKEIAGFSFWTTLILIAERFILNITPTILGIFAGSVQIAIFSVGRTIEGYTWTISAALGGMFLPKVSRMTGNRKSANLIENLMIKVGRIELLVVSLIVIGFASMGYEFMKLWMGSDFLNSYHVALLLILPLVISVTENIASTTLIALNKVKHIAICSLVTAGISIGLSLVLSRTYGAVGAAAGIFAGFIGGILVSNIVYYKVLGLNIFRFFRECHLKMMIPLLLALGFGFLMQYYFPVDNMFLFMVKAGVFAAVYSLLMWTMALNSYEKQLFSDTVNKALHKLKRRSNETID